MRSIFLKIFLWFWLTLVVVSIAMALVWSIQPDLLVSRWRASTAEAVSLYAQSTAEEMDRYGLNALNNYLQRLEASGHIRAGLLDETLHTIAGQPPVAAIALAPRAQLAGEPVFAIRTGAAYVAQRVAGPSGRVYIFAAEMPRGPVGAFRLPPWRVLLVRWTIAAIVSAVICYFLALYLTRPILRLRSAAAEIARGNLAARADPAMERRRDEIGELVQDFNHMASRIESLVMSQRQLIRDISHELRSPLARLTVALGLARKRSGDQLAATLDRIEREAERLNDLIGKLLSLARIEAASTPPERSRVDLRELLADVVADGNFEARERNCTVELVADGACEVNGNPGMLRSAFENVVRNAIRHTAPGSSVVVQLKPGAAPGWVEVTIRDHGPGVPEAELAKLFRPFYRVEHARERDTGGSGLGLAITEGAVRLHGGTVGASNAPDGGLTVRLQLPCADKA